MPRLIIPELSRQKFSYRNCRLHHRHRNHRFFHCDSRNRRHLTDSHILYKTPRLKRKDALWMMPVVDRKDAWFAGTVSHCVEGPAAMTVARKVSRRFFAAIAGFVESSRWTAFLMPIQKSIALFTELTVGPFVSFEAVTGSISTDPPLCCLSQKDL